MIQKQTHIYGDIKETLKEINRMKNNLIENDSNINYLLNNIYYIIYQNSKLAKKSI